MTRKDKVYNFLKEGAKMPLNFEEMSIMLSVPESDKEELFYILEELMLVEKL